MALHSWKYLLQYNLSEINILADKYKEASGNQREQLIERAAITLATHPRTLERRLNEYVFYRNFLADSEVPPPPPPEQKPYKLTKDDERAEKKISRFFQSISRIGGKDISPLSAPPEPPSEILVPGEAMPAEDISAFVASLNLPTPSPSATEIEEIVYLEGDAGNNFMVIGDVEMPDYDPLTIRLMLALAAKENIRTLVINGDFFAMDPTFFTGWAQEYRTGNEISFRGIRSVGLQLIWACFEWFDRVIMVTGNHDARINKATSGEVFWDIMVERSDAETTSYYYCYAESDNGPYLICHPSNYSKNQLIVPQDLETIEPDHCHVISSHTHHCAMGHSKNGRWIVMEPGCVRRHALYKDKKKTRHNQWVNGFGMIKDGFPELYPIAQTNWNWRLGKQIYNEIVGL